MALSSIQGQTSVGSTVPGGLTAAIGIDITPPKSAPEGYSISVAGRNTQVAEGTYCIVFGYTVPAGKRVDPAESGSLEMDGRSYDGMFVKVVDDANEKTANTAYWEVWFTEADINGADWNSEVKFGIGGSNYTYLLRKKRTGGEL